MSQNQQTHYHWAGRTLCVRLKVVPRASQDKVMGLLGDRLKVAIKAPPVDGRANAYLIKWFAGLCGVPKSSVTVTAGQSSRDKTIAVENPRRVPVEWQVAESDS